MSKHKSSKAHHDTKRREYNNDHNRKSKSNRDRNRKDKLKEDKRRDKEKDNRKEERLQKDKRTDNRHREEKQQRRTDNRHREEKQQRRTDNRHREEKRTDNRHREEKRTDNRCREEKQREEKQQREQQDISQTQLQQFIDPDQIDENHQTAGFIFIYEANGVFFSKLDDIDKTEGRLVVIHPVFYAGYDNNMESEEVVYDEDQKKYISGSDEGSWLDVIYGFPGSVHVMDLDTIILYDEKYFHCDGCLLIQLIGEPNFVQLK
jgi:hypothetical protein